MEGNNSIFSLHNKPSELPRTSSPREGPRTLREERPLFPGDLPPSAVRQDLESDASFSSINSPLSPLEIDNIQVTPIAAENTNTPGPDLSIKASAVNHSPTWRKVPVMDIEQRRKSPLPACLYSKGENPKEVEFAINSKLSFIDNEPELQPSALENLDSSGFSFIPDLTTSSNISVDKSPGGKTQSCTEEYSDEEGSCDEEENVGIRDHSSVDDDKETSTSTPLRLNHGFKSSAESTEDMLTSVGNNHSTPLNLIRRKYLELTPDGAMNSANSSGFFGLSDLEDTPQKVDTAPYESRHPDNSTGTGPLKTSGYPCPLSVRSEDSVDGVDAEPHSPINSPHSSTSGNISDLSESSFNMGEVMPRTLENEGQSSLGHKVEGQNEGQGQSVVQGETRGLLVVSKNQIDPNAYFTLKKVENKSEENTKCDKENTDPEKENTNLDMRFEYEDISPPASHLSQHSEMSTASSLQKNDEPTKPTETYISLIAKAMLTKRDRRMMLHEIYAQITSTHEFYRKTGSDAWRNAVRHNLSVNECFIKVGKADTGRGFFWTIHPACVQQFTEGDFQRREARRKVKDMEDKEAAKVMFASRMNLQFPNPHFLPHHPHVLQQQQQQQQQQQHHSNMMYHNYHGNYQHQHGYHGSVPNQTVQLQSLNHHAEVLNGPGVHPIRSRDPLTPTDVNSATREQQRYKPYYHPHNNQRQMAALRPNRKLCDLEEIPPNVTVNSLGLFVRSGPIRR